MSATEDEIVVEDPDAPVADSPPVTSTRTVEIILYLLLIALSLLLAFDNWRTGMGWASDGPQAGYFPFYLSVILAGASIFGLVTIFIAKTKDTDSFVTHDQLRRVMQVFVPTLLFCLFMQWLGLYVASFLLIAGFMWKIGHIAPWKSLVTGFVFTMAMFVTFEIAFDVIMPKGPLETLFGY